jgi:Mg-chelatase subunit ChlD
VPQGSESRRGGGRPRSNVRGIVTDGAPLGRLVRPLRAGIHDASTTMISTMHLLTTATLTLPFLAGAGPSATQEFGANAHLEGARAISSAGAAGQEEQGQEDAAEEEVDEGPRILDELATRGLVVRYGHAEHWTMQCLVLLSLGVSWHPQAVPIFVSALDGKEPRVRAFALEVLHRAQDDCLACNATPELVTVLIETSLKDRDEHFAARAEQILARIFPDADAGDRSKWRAFWRGAIETYEVAPWVALPVDPDKPKNTVSGGALDRAMDLREAGLELCFCIDATGSMGPLISATAGAAEQVTGLLNGFAPDLRVASVYYRDEEDMSGAAKVLDELTTKYSKVFKRIGNLAAEGGGDIPEAVERGLEVALDRKEVGWSLQTNKLVIIMGDAPPHPPNVPRAEALATQARERPLGFEAKKRGSSSSGRTATAAPRPFVISCIGVGQGSVESRTEESFRRIATAGGGIYAALSVGAGESQVRAASRGIVAHVLRMTFGERWEREVGEFLAIYFDYLDREYFD